VRGEDEGKYRAFAEDVFRCPKVVKWKLRAVRGGMGRLFFSESTNKMGSTRRNI
jgi:hypothetical protein